MNTLIWKLIAAGLLLALLLVGTGTGWSWYLAARDRDAVRADLVLERDKSAELAAGIQKQNEAIALLAEQKAGADQRGLVAQQLAAANGKRFDNALAQVRHAKATTCAEAMPAVNAVLEAIR